ncbi:uncharacterized protein FRV6_14452 [Fusarium oxysporum]|uniref:Delta(24)-sterol reductase n=1 Tax=Fusarium oxysporum TaxID=5507 RepID=A0A2H3TNU8_FUSOX|nr:uncharacterized protein FRV6_14452 [Fusarium oxysporum]
MERHNQILQDIADKIRDFYKLRQPYRVFHGSSSCTRPSHATDTNVIDISMLSQVISVDSAQRTCLVEPNIPMDWLVEATMPFSLISPVVMEFPGITAGGGFAGTSGESSSFRHGFFNETVNFVEMILGNGDKIRASREEHEDLFHGAAGAAGTLGCRTPTLHPVTKGSSDTGTGDNMSQPMLNIEKKLMELGGRKWLYAHTYYTEEQFRELNDRCWYQELRKRYFATMLPTVYDEVKKSGLDADERDGKGWGLGTLLNKWSIGGIYGMIMAFYSGDINLHRRARWSPTRLYLSHSYVIHKYVLINWATVMLPDSNADMQINILADGGVHEDDVSVSKALQAARHNHNLNLCFNHPNIPRYQELSLKKTRDFVEMVERSFQYLPRLNFTDSPFKQFTIPQDWRVWEVAWLYRLPAIITHASYPARLIESGCIIDNVTNCHKACGSEEHMFSNPETLWNCLTLATVSMMSTNRGPDTISNQTLEEVDRKFNTGRLDEFWKLGALLSYVKCALQSCSDSKFGGCPPELWTFQCQMITSKNIKDLGRIMSTEYCDKADPGIDYDIAGPGIIVAYLIQFTTVLLFALCYKITKTWIRNLTLISLLPFQGPAAAVETAFQWQKMVSRSTFGVAVASTLVDLQEAQAVFLGTISIAAIITFSSSSGTGLGNISSLLSWLTNNLTVRGMVSAGMYPLLFVQLILQKTHNRWWYTLVLVFINWVLVVLIARPQTVDESSLLEHFTDSSPLERCGNHTGPRTFCQTFNKPAERGSSSTTGEELGHLDRDAESFFKFHSRIQAPMHVIMAFLILDWILAMIRMHLLERGDWLSHKAHALMDSLPLRLKSFYTRRYFVLFTEAIWISMEVLTIVMGAIGVHEFAAFMHLLSGGESGNESKVALSKWGFGQLVAVCVWVPVILKFACLMVDGALPGWRKRLGQFIEITQRKENNPDGNDVVMETLLPSRPTKRGQTEEVEGRTLTARRSWGRS